MATTTLRRILEAVAVMAVWLAVRPTAAEPLTIRAAHVAPEGSPWDLAMHSFIKQLRALVPIRSATVLAGAAVGDEESHLLQCRRGTIQVCGLSDFYMSRLVPELGVFSIPFLFRDEQEVELALERATPRLRAAYREQGLHLQGLSGLGWLDIATRTPAASITELAGRRIRVSESPFQAQLVRALGAVPFPTSMLQAETAMQIGAVDGILHTQVFLQGAGWYTSIRHVWEARLVHGVTSIVINQAFWQRLPADARRSLERSWQQTSKVVWSGLREATPVIRDELSRSGVVFHVPSEADREALRRTLMARRGPLEAQLGARGRALLAEIETALEAHRKRTARD